MPAKAKRKPKAKPARQAPRIERMQQRGLSMPKYDYQSPRTGTVVIHYDDPQQQKKENVALPALNNFMPSFQH